MEKKILYIDMDGVIADFDKAIKKYCPELHTGDHEENYEERSKQVYKICGDNPNIFLECEPMPYSQMYVRALMDLYDVYFLSTPMWQVPQSYTDKRIWIRKHFGPKTDHRLILTPRKDLNIGDYLIDDRLKNGAAEFQGCHIHFSTSQFPDWHTVFKFLVDEYDEKPKYPHDIFIGKFSSVSDVQETVTEYFGLDESFQGSVVDCCWAHWKLIGNEKVIYAEAKDKVEIGNPDCFTDEIKTYERFDEEVVFQKEFYTAVVIPKGDLIIFSNIKQL